MKSLTAFKSGTPQVSKNFELSQQHTIKALRAVFVYLTFLTNLQSIDAIIIWPEPRSKTSRKSVFFWLETKAIFNMNLRRKQKTWLRGIRFNTRSARPKKATELCRFSTNWPETAWRLLDHQLEKRDHSWSHRSIFGRAERDAVGSESFCLFYMNLQIRYITRLSILCKRLYLGLI